MSSQVAYPQAKIKRALALFDATKTASNPKGNINEAARRARVPCGTLHKWLSNRDTGHEAAVQVPRKKLLKDLAELLREHGPELSWHRYKQVYAHPGAHQRHWTTWDAFRAEALRQIPDATKLAPERVFTALKQKPATIDEIAHKLSVTDRAALKGIEAARGAGYNIQLRGDFYQVENTPGPREHDPKLNVFTSDERGVLRYGIVSDNHIGSKYARLDVLDKLYDFFQSEGITRVYNCGNWIDGEARFNRHDLEPWAHGMDNQLREFARLYPQRKGIQTYYVAGDDHEGWYDGVDVGLRAQQTAREAGREDLHYLGYMEAFIRMRHKKHGNGCVAAFVHPGGGSAYAISYSPQKIVESYQGGEKPAVVHLGHYHKMDVFNYRNVWIMQVGCTQDQTPFMRKKRIEAHVGGILAELRLDERGAITDCITWQKRYFDRGYYNYQFDRAGPLGRIAVPD